MAPVSDRAVRDPGLQPERTRMAWRRTTLSGAVVALLAVRHALRGGFDPGAGLLLAGTALGWLGLLWAAHRRMRMLARRRPAAPAPRVTAVAGACTAVLAACGVLLVALAPH